MKESIDVLCNFAARNLPDSLAERKKVLRAIIKLLADRHPLYRNVQAQLASIAVVEKFDAQLKMPLTDKKSKPQSDQNHNGGTK